MANDTININDQEYEISGTVSGMAGGAKTVAGALTPELYEALDASAKARDEAVAEAAGNAVSAVSQRVTAAENSASAAHNELSQHINAVAAANTALSERVEAIESSGSGVTMAAPAVTGSDRAPIGYAIAISFSALPGLQNTAVAYFTIEIPEINISARVDASAGAGSFSFTTPAGTAADTVLNITIVAYDTIGNLSLPASHQMIATDACIYAPSLSMNFPVDDVYETPTFTLGAFTPSSGTDSHTASEIEVYAVSDTSTPVWTSTGGAVLTFTMPEGILQEGHVSYRARARQTGALYGIGAWSEWLEFTTTDNFFDPLCAIGTPGTQGFGVGVCPHTAAEIAALGLTAMTGCTDPASDNYGNYQHTNGSIFVWIPLFAYRIGSTSSPVYSKYGANSLDIIGQKEFQSEARANALGYTVHRAFIDGGELKKGFFRSKYSASIESSTIKFVKNGHLASLTSSYTYKTSSVSGGEGNTWDAITLTRSVFGTNFNCETAFITSALAMLSLAHGEYATASTYCAWYDSTGTMNFPKGCNTSLKDTNDASVTFTTCGDSVNANKPLAGSGSVFAKTTHNGQNSGIADLNGSMWRCCIGLSYIESAYRALKESVSIKTLTKENLLTASLYDTCSPANGSKWGNGDAACLYDDVNGVNRALCGVTCKDGGSSSSGTNLFGCDYNSFYAATLLVAGGHWNDGAGAGVFCRDSGSWGYGSSSCGWGAAAYL